MSEKCRHEPSLPHCLFDHLVGERDELVRNINAKHLRGVVFISSTASRFGARGFSMYSASKGALDAFMRAMAVELAPDVRVNSVLPGAVTTRMTEAMLSDPQLSARMAEGIFP